MFLRASSIVITSYLLVTLSSYSFAHSSFLEKEFIAGETVELSLQIAHGCDGNPTRAVSIQMPNGPDLDPHFGEAVMRVKPKINTNWLIIKPEYGEVIPFESHGKIYNQDIRKITWKAGRLPSDFYEYFQFKVNLPLIPEGETEMKLYFPVTQKCTRQTKNEWIEIPIADEQLSKPSPYIIIRKAMDN